MRLLPILALIALVGCGERLPHGEHHEGEPPYRFGDLIPSRPRQGELDSPSICVDASKFYVYAVGPGMTNGCGFGDCGPGGDEVERLGGYLVGDGEHEAGVPATLDDSYVLVADAKARIVGVYPHCTVTDLSIILPLHPETGAVAEPVPKHLPRNARCRPVSTTAPLSVIELWREAMRASLHPTLNRKAHGPMPTAL